MTREVGSHTEDVRFAGSEPSPSTEPTSLQRARETRRWVERAQAGDVRAFEYLYRDHVGRVYALALRMTADAREAEEATQDVWVRVWERLETFRADSSFSTWLHRLAVNRILDRMRSRKRREGRSASLDDPGVNRWGTEPSKTEERMELERAIAALPEGARTVFVLHEVEGLKCREVAEATGTAVGTVKAQLHRARKLLRGMLTP